MLLPHVAVRVSAKNSKTVTLFILRAKQTLYFYLATMLPSYKLNRILIQFECFRINFQGL